MKRRLNTERFHSQREWLDSWHTFSFAEHDSPDWRGFGPLRVINDDTIAAGRGFGMHPHRDMEIVSVMVDGQLTHQDSMGHQEVLNSGEVQRMSAGTGIVHSEMNQGASACRLIQIWIEPRHANLPPAYEQKAFTIGRDWTPLLDPAGQGGAMAVAQAMQLWRAQPQKGDRLSIPATAQGSKIWLQVINGTLESTAPNGTPMHLERGDGVGTDRDDPKLSTLMGSESGADVLLFSLNATNNTRH